MATAPDEILKTAVERGAPAVLSLPSEAMLRNYKSRFLGRASRGIWVEAELHEKPLIDALIASGRMVGVSSKMRFEKLQFVAPILKVDPEFAVSEACRVCAVLVGEPQRVVLTQRRNDYRVRVLPDHEISAQIWQIPEQVYLGDRPSSRQLLKCDVRDFSIGGLGVAVAAKDQLPARVTQGERLRVLLTYTGDEVLLEARLAHAVIERSKVTNCGLEFQHLERDLEGRQKLAKLNKLLAELQRDEVRRNRHSAAA